MTYIAAYLYISGALTIFALAVSDEVRPEEAAIKAALFPVSLPIIAVVAIFSKDENK